MVSSSTRIRLGRRWLIAASLLVPLLLWSKPLRDVAEYTFRGTNFALKAWAYPAIDLLPLVLGLCIFWLAVRNLGGRLLWAAAYAIAMVFIGFWYILSWDVRHWKLPLSGLNMLPNNAFERPVKGPTLARVRRAIHFAPSARLQARRPAAQRER